MARNISTKSVGTGFWLQLFAGIFLITAGVLGIIHYNSNLQQFGRAINELFGKSNNPLTLVFAIIELAVGIVFVLNCLFTMSRTLISLSAIVIIIVWIIRTIMTYFTASIFEPDFIIWLNGVASNLLFIIVFWSVFKRR